MFYVRVRTDAIFLEYRSFLFYVESTMHWESSTKIIISNFRIYTVITLKLDFSFRRYKYYWSCISLFRIFFSQLCSIDLTQASLHNSYANLLVKCTPLLQVCALLGLVFALVPPLAYQQKCNSSRKQTICMLGAIPSIYSQNFIFVNPLPHTL